MLLSAAVLALCAGSAEAQKGMNDPLPPGGGTSSQGVTIFRQHCTKCHSLHGTYQPTPTIGNCFVDPVRLFNYVKYYMPPGAKKPFKDTEVYDLIAYILVTKKITDVSDVINSKTLPQISFNETGLIASGCAIEAGGFGGKFRTLPKDTPALIPAPPRLHPLASPAPAPPRPKPAPKPPAKQATQ
jgi:hypothetical protein